MRIMALSMSASFPCLTRPERAQELDEAVLEIEVRHFPECDAVPGKPFLHVRPPASHHPALQISRFGLPRQHRERRADRIAPDAASNPDPLVAAAELLHRQLQHPEAAVHHPDRRRLAAAVRTEKPVQRSARHLEREVLDGEFGARAIAQSLDLDRRGHDALPPPPSNSSRIAWRSSTNPASSSPR